MARLPSIETKNILQIWVAETYVFDYKKNKDFDICIKQESIYNTPYTETMHNPTKRCTVEKLVIPKVEMKT